MIFFWFVIQGICTNSVFVIFNSVAKKIDASSVALVYIANSGPVLFVKLFAPYWYDRIGYRSRYLISAVLFSGSLVFVAISISPGATFSHALFGVALSSAAGGLSETSSLALATKIDKETLITAFSTGTGCAGVVGYLWTIIFIDFLGLESYVVLFLALLIPISLYFNFTVNLEPLLLQAKKLHTDEHDTLIASKSQESNKQISFKDKFAVFLYLRPYMLLLFLVYFAEYLMQSGVWASMGIPVTEKKARDEFYLYSNFMYQIGVLCSRSSAVFFHLSFKVNTLIPFLQILLFLAFYTNATIWFIEDQNVLLFFCFVAGCFGGLVYVNTFILIAKDERINPDLKEFSVAAANMADTLGIISGDVIGLLIQACLYGANRVTDFDSVPELSCGYDFKKP